MAAAARTAMARPKRVIAGDEDVTVPPAARARVSPPSPDELVAIVVKLQAQAVLDQQMWVAVEEAFDTHATRIEYLSHQDLQWNDDFATAVDGMRKAMEQLDGKVGQQLAQVVHDLTGTILKAENDLKIVIHGADSKFTEGSDALHRIVAETRGAFVAVEQAFIDPQQNFAKTEELVKKGLTVKEGVFVAEGTAVHSMSSPPRASTAPGFQPSDAWAGAAAAAAQAGRSTAEMKYPPVLPGAGLPEVRAPPSMRFDPRATPWAQYSGPSFFSSPPQDAPAAAEAPGRDGYKLKASGGVDPGGLPGPQIHKAAPEPPWAATGASTAGPGGGRPLSFDSKAFETKFAQEKQNQWDGNKDGHGWREFIRCYLIGRLPQVKHVLKWAEQHKGQ